jgi:hypothetical protein
MRPPEPGRGNSTRRAFAARAYLWILIGVYFVTFSGNLFEPLPIELRETMRWAALFFCVPIIILQCPRRSSELTGTSLAGIGFVGITFCGLASSMAFEIAFLKWIAMATQVIAFVVILPPRAPDLLWKDAIRSAHLVSTALVGFSVLGIGSSSAYIATGGANRFGGALEMNPNTLGLLALISFSIGLWQLEDIRRGRLRAAFVIGGLIASSACFVLCQSRSSAAGACAAVIFSAAVASGHQKHHLKLVAITGILAAALYLGYGFVQPFFAGFDRENGNILAARQNRWEEALGDFRENPWLGKGFGTTGVAQERSAQGGRSIGAVVDGGGYPAVLASVGLIGAAALALLLRGVALRLREMCTRKGATLTHLAAGSLIIGLLVNLVGEPWLLGPGSPVHLIFWMAVGTVTTCKLRYKLEPGARWSVPARKAPAMSAGFSIAQRVPPSIGIGRASGRATGLVCESCAPRGRR